MCMTSDSLDTMQLSCFLVTAWEAFAQWEEKTIWEQPVEFLDVSVHMPVQAERTARVILGGIFDYSNHFQVRHWRQHNLHGSFSPACHQASPNTVTVHSAQTRCSVLGTQSSECVTLSPCQQ